MKWGWGPLAAMIALAPAPAAAWADLDFACDHPTWAGGTTEWHFNTDYGSDDMAVPTVQQVVQDSFDEWNIPGCSQITATQGTTQTGYPNPNGSVVFFEDARGWPMDATILAYATPTPGAGCSIGSAAIVVNAVTYTWSVGGATDLQSVMTHEVGHWLGLDRSSYAPATMAACYSGGTDCRTLACDDTEGICVLYPSGSQSCSSDDYCLDEDADGDGIPDEDEGGEAARSAGTTPSTPRAGRDVDGRLAGPPARCRRCRGAPVRPPQALSCSRWPRTRSDQPAGLRSRPLERRRSRLVGAQPFAGPGIARGVRWR